MKMKQPAGARAYGQEAGRWNRGNGEEENSALPMYPGEGGKEPHTACIAWAPMWVYVAADETELSAKRARRGIMKMLYAALCIAAMMCVSSGAAAVAEDKLLPVVEFFDEFKQDEAAAKRKYMNRRVAIEGEVHTIENSAEKREIIFDAGGNGSDTVVCRLHKSVKGNIARILLGRSAVMLGVFSSFEANSLTLTDCIFGQFRRK